MDDDHICRMERIGTVLIRMFDGIVRELKDVRYVPQLKKNMIYWSFGSTGPYRYSCRWCSKKAQKLDSYSKGC